MVIHVGQQICPRSNKGRDLCVLIALLRMPVSAQRKLCVSSRVHSQTKRWTSANTAEVYSRRTFLCRTAPPAQNVE